MVATPRLHERRCPQREQQHYVDFLVNENGDLGGVFNWGGGGNYPNLNAFIWDDRTCDPYSCGWENYWAAGSSASSNVWGDYIDARSAYPDTQNWVASGWSYDGFST